MATEIETRFQGLEGSAFFILFRLKAMKMKKKSVAIPPSWPNNRHFGIRILQIALYKF